MLGLVYLAWLYFRKLKLPRGRKYHPSHQHVNTAMTLSPVNTRRWQRCQVDFPLHIIVSDGAQRIEVRGCGTELSQGGMALYAGLTLKPGDPIEVEFRTPPKLQIVGIIRNRTGYYFGLEFLTPLPS